MPFSLVGLGEALFDILPDGEILGGAPLNVSVHAHQFVSARGGRGVVVSRVGQDDLGRRILDQLRERGMATDFVQTDPDRSTGRVFVSIDAEGQPAYDIVQNAAWDWIQHDPDLEDLAGRCDAVCFGTLAQRNSQSRHTIYRFLDACTPRTVRMLDVNLRQNYHDAAILRRSLEFANALKLNDEELPVVADALMIGASGDDAEDRIGRIIGKFDLKLLALTRGAKGTVLFTPADRCEGAPARYDPEPGADAVGAGDACTAAILVGMVSGWPLDRTVQMANEAGAYVASRAGGTPALPQALVKKFEG